MLIAMSRGFCLTHIKSETKSASIERNTVRNED